MYPVRMIVSGIGVVNEVTNFQNIALMVYALILINHMYGGKHICKCKKNETNMLFYKFRKLSLPINLNIMIDVAI